MYLAILILTVIAAAAGGWTIVERWRTRRALSTMEEGTFVIDGGDVYGNARPLEPGQFSIGSLMKAMKPTAIGDLAPWITVIAAIAAAILTFLAG